MIIKFLKRHWQKIPFAGLMVTALITGRWIIAVLIFVYFFAVIFPIEKRHWQREVTERAAIEKGIKKYQFP